MDSVYQDWHDVRPENDVDSFTERSDERRQAFEEARALGRNTALAPVTWAFLQVADLEQVRLNIRRISKWDDLQVHNHRRVLDAVRLWRQKPAAKDVTAGNATPAPSRQIAASSQPPSTSSSASVAPDSTSRTRSKRKRGQQEYSLARSPTVAQSCKQRDGNQCAVSKMGEIDAAHIYPWCAFGDEDTLRVGRFWQVLEMFWPPALVETWRAKIFVDSNFPDRGTETVENMISLTATLHRFHTAGVFALRPIQMSDDKTQLELEFHWLVREERKSSDKVDLMDEPSSSRDRSFSVKGYGPFIRIDETGAISTPLVSGTRFTLSTDDPLNRPLPDPGLLALQWHLQRVLAMSGAAGWKEEEFGDDDEDDGLGEAIEHRVEPLLGDSLGSELDDSEDM